MRAQPTILIASDLSPRSDRAFDRAVDLALHLHAGLLLVHVLEKGDSGTADIMESKARAAIAKLSHGIDVPLEARLAKGRAPEAIASAAQDEMCQLMVVGPARHNDVGDFLLGTAVDYLVRRATAPVLVVKQRPTHPYRRMLVATDFSDCSLRALLTAIDLFPDVTLDLVHVYDGSYASRLDPEETRALARTEAERDSAAFLARPELAGHAAALHIELIEGRCGEMLPRLVTAREIDLLVLGSHGRSGFVHALIGSRASELLESAPCDVLMVRLSR